MKTNINASIEKRLEQIESALAKNTDRPADWALKVVREALEDLDKCYPDTRLCNEKDIEAIALTFTERYGSLDAFEIDMERDYTGVSDEEVHQTVIDLVEKLKNRIGTPQ
jgi:hypothetical protein